MRKLLKKYLKLSLKYRDLDSEELGNSEELGIAQTIHLYRLAREAGIDIQRVFGYLTVLDDKVQALRLPDLPIEEEYRACIRLIEEICKDS